MSSTKETADSLRKALNYFWTRTFVDQGYVDAVTGSIGIRAQTTRELEDKLKNYLSRHEIPVFKIHDTRLFTFSTRDMDTDRHKYGEDRVYGDASLQYGTQDTDPDMPRFPIGKFVPPYLSLSILEPSTVLTLDKDYTVSNGWLTFTQSPLRDSRVEKTVHADTQGTYRTFSYWGFRAEEDQHDLCSFYGTVAGICGQSSEDLKRAINIAWDLRVQGASVSLMHRTFSLLGDVDYTHTGGVVRDIYSEGDRVCVRTEDNVYTAPAGAVPTVVKGQTIFQNDTLFDTFQIHAGTEVLSSDFLAGLTLGKGYIQLPSEGGMHFGNSRVPVSTYKPEGWYELERDGTDFLVRNRGGNIISVVPESEATELIDNNPGLYRRFAVGGQAEDIEEFFERLNVPAEDGSTFFSRLEQKYGKIPDTIVPFEEMRDFYLQANSVFVKLQSQLLSSQVTAQLINVLRSVIPAGTTFFLTNEISDIEDTFISGQVAETVDVFYISDIEEDDETVKSENLAPVGYC
jgi:hypothetical protein